MPRHEMPRTTQLRRYTLYILSHTGNAHQQYADAYATRLPRAYAVRAQAAPRRRWQKALYV